MSAGLSRAEDHQKLRDQLVMQGRCGSDDIRWEIGPQIYPNVVKGQTGEVVDTKFADGYTLYKNQLLTIPDTKTSSNLNLT